jgi:hypothetical protein
VLNRDALVQIKESCRRKRDKSAPSADHVNNPDSSFRVARGERCNLEGRAHPRRECLAPVFFCEADEVFQQQRLDAVPDESPDDIKEKDAEGNARDRLPADFIALEEAAGAVRENREYPERRQRRVEDERTAEDAVGSLQPGVVDIRSGGVIGSADRIHGPPG